MAAVAVSFRWLDILEKEFDKAFVDLEIIVGDLTEYDDSEGYSRAQSRLQALSSCFAQLTHKAQTIFESNAKLEAELVHLRREAAEGRAQLLLNRQQQKQMTKCLELENADNSTAGEDVLQHPLLGKKELGKCAESEQGHSQQVLPDVTQSEQNHQDELHVAVLQEEQAQLQGENTALRRLMLSMQGELCGARLAAKYLDKELAGRIQQLQLLCREVRWQQDHDKLWRQLEAEITLHRHKTVVRACRASIPVQNGMQSVCESAAASASPVPGLVLSGGVDEDPRPDPAHYHRTVIIEKRLGQSLGMSVTGGREHGVPIVVSVVHPDSPASLCGQLYVGDAILTVNGVDLSQMSHTDAVALLSRPAESVTLQLMFVPPEDDDSSSLPDDPFAFKYRVFDDDVVSVSSSVVGGPAGAVGQRGRGEAGRLSRASLDSIRGSQDNLDGLDDGELDTYSHPGLRVAATGGVCVTDDIGNKIPNDQLESLEEVLTRKPLISSIASPVLSVSNAICDNKTNGIAENLVRFPEAALTSNSNNLSLFKSDQHCVPTIAPVTSTFSASSTAPTVPTSSTVTTTTSTSTHHHKSLSCSSARKPSVGDSPPPHTPSLGSYSSSPVSLSSQPLTPVHRKSAPCYPGSAGLVTSMSGGRKERGLDYTAGCRYDRSASLQASVGCSTQSPVGACMTVSASAIAAGVATVGTTASASVAADGGPEASTRTAAAGRDSTYVDNTGGQCAVHPSLAALQRPLQEVEQLRTTPLSSAPSGGASVAAADGAEASGSGTLFNGNY